MWSLILFIVTDDICSWWVVAFVKCETNAVSLDELKNFVSGVGWNECQILIDNGSLSCTAQLIKP